MSRVNLLGVALIFSSVFLIACDADMDDPLVEAFVETEESL